MAKTEDVQVLGRVIGTSEEGWNQPDDWTIQFYEVTLNDLGLKFLPRFTQGWDLAISFDTGEVQESSASEDDNSSKLNPDWSVFNS